MIRLKEAIKQAEKFEDVPAKRSINYWCEKSYISKMIDFADDGMQGRTGLYPDRLPAEIITNIRLRNKYNYKLKEIKKVREYLKEKNLFGDDRELEAELFFKMLDYNSEVVEGREKISQLAADGADPEEIDQAVKELNEQMKFHEMIENYIQEYLEAIKNLENKSLSKAN